MVALMCEYKAICMYGVRQDGTNFPMKIVVHKYVVGNVTITNAVIK